jgi:hypothetical protein
LGVAIGPGVGVAVGSVVGGGPIVDTTIHEVELGGKAVDAIVVLVALGVGGGVLIPHPVNRPPETNPTNSSVTTYQAFPRLFLRPRHDCTTTSGIIASQIPNVESKY